MKNITPELIEKAKTAQSAEALLALAKENSTELTEEEAKTYFAQINRAGAVSDDELDAIVGGGCFGDDDDADGSTLHTLDTLPEGTCVEIVNGKKCKGCGGTRGIVKPARGVHFDANSANLGVYCTKCAQWIMYDVTMDSVVKV